MLSSWSRLPEINQRLPPVSQSRLGKCYTNIAIKLWQLPHHPLMSIFKCCTPQTGKLSQYFLSSFPTSYMLFHLISALLYGLPGINFQSIPVISRNELPSIIVLTYHKCNHIILIHKGCLFTSWQILSTISSIPKLDCWDIPAQMDLWTTRPPS